MTNNWLLINEQTAESEWKEKIIELKHEKARLKAIKPFDKQLVLNLASRGDESTKITMLREFEYNYRMKQANIDKEISLLKLKIEAKDD